ncbi:amidohydrolase family protein [Shimia thalassica]|uniref:amidohydrolase family protein n=1 Tax=Shimia thalassica TaxID=1715693 RepID=UPI0026E443DF|nr:amidohydrolase family protein [Shimia thalassica]MDO6480731.1 amidohydrolase family protein [Shimia thalassica]
MKHASQRTLPDMRVPTIFVKPRTSFSGEEGGGFLRGDVVVVDNRIVGMRPSDKHLDGRILMPRLVEAHCHLDKCHTVERMAVVGGNLEQAILAQRQDKANWTDQDILSRAKRGLAEFVTAGTGMVRSHVDWGDTAPPPRSWSLLCALAEEASQTTLQLSALVGVAQMSDRSFAKQVVASIPDGHALGAFVFGQDGLEAGLRNIFDCATDRGLPLDFHVDEGLSPDLNGLEMIADIALENGFSGPILCGHAVSLAVHPTATRNRIIEKLSKAGICVAMLPTTNLYLQGRNGGTPTMRGITLAKELDQAGVPVVVGTDNVRDAFCPVGRHDPMYALEMAILGAHLDPPFDTWLKTITTNACIALGADAPSLNGAPLDDVLLCDATDFSTLISGASRRPANTYFEV